MSKNILEPDELPEFGRQVRMLRKRMGLTQRELADLIGIKYAQVSHFENGTRGPSMRSYRALMDLMNDKPAELLPSAPGGLLLLSWR